MRKVHRILKIRRRRRRKWLLRMPLKLMTPKRALTPDETTASDSENTIITQAENPCKHCENSTVYKTLILK